MRETDKKKEETIITDRGTIAMLEYENKLLPGKLMASSIVTSILASVLTIIILKGILG